MGTRGLLGFISRHGTRRNAAYNHYDSYPSQLGSQIVKFILKLKPEEWDEMAKKVEEIEWIVGTPKPSEELQRKYLDLGYTNINVGEQSLEDWCCLLHRVQGAPALDAIWTGGLKHMQESINFLSSRLFCEWAYFVDFENKKLEIYQYGVLVNTESFESMSPGAMMTLENDGDDEKDDGIGPEDEEEPEEEEPGQEEPSEEGHEELANKIEAQHNSEEQVRSMDGAWDRVMAARTATSAEENQG